VIQEGDDAQYWQGYTLNGFVWIRCVLNRYVNGGIVHVVLNAVAVHHLETANIVFREVEVRGDIDTSTKGISTGTEGRSHGRVHPGNLAKNAGKLQVTPVTHEARLPGKVRDIELRFDILQFHAVDTPYPSSAVILPGIARQYVVKEIKASPI